MKISINAKIFNAVSVCKEKKGYREMLQGVYLAPSGDVVGTDGHRMGLAQLHFASPEGFTGAIVCPQSAIPAKAETLIFDFETKLI